MDSLPVPLLMQCLLYLIGNLFDDDDKPIPGLALLPRSIRIKLLLLLPAVDVHKLEGTSVTSDILMDEIWETLYKERTCNKCWPLNKYIYLLSFSWKDLYFSYMFTCHHTTSYEANKELSAYFTHVKESVYNGYKIATFHNVIWSPYRNRVTTKTFQSKELTMSLDGRYLDLALTMIDLHIPLKIVTNYLFQFDHDILIKLTQSAEAIFWRSRRVNSAEIEKFFKIIFIENECCINSCICEEYVPLLLDYLQQQCDLKILYVNILQIEDTVKFQEDEKFQEVVKRHKNLEVVSIGRGIYDNNCIQCLSELMYRQCFQQLNIDLSSLSPSFNDVHSLLSAFFLSPYPVTLRLMNEVCKHIPVPLAINTEQQSKSLDVALYLLPLSGHLLGDSSHILESNFLPQYIVLKSLKIRSYFALYLFSK